jgi:hypothetical protein
VFQVKAEESDTQSQHLKAEIFLKKIMWKFFHAQKNDISFYKIPSKKLKSSPSYFENQPNFSLPYHPRKNP